VDNPGRFLEILWAVNAFAHCAKTDARTDAKTDGGDRQEHALCAGCAGGSFSVKA